METTSMIALSRQGALRRQLNVVANNIANANTHGYKSERMMFIEHVTRTRGGDTNPVFQKMSFVRDIATATDTRDGNIEKTGNPFDVAIAGDGYFVLETAAGERFTRNGHFQLDSTGQLVAENGAPVLTEDGPLTLGAEDTEITIAPDGSITTANGVIGRLRIVTFENPQRLERGAAGIFTSRDPAQPAENPQLIQGALEQSNVEPVLEITRMIDIHRRFDSVKDFLRREDERQIRMVRQLNEQA